MTLVANDSKLRKMTSRGSSPGLPVASMPYSNSARVPTVP